MRLASHGVRNPEASRGVLNVTRGALKHFPQTIRSVLLASLLVGTLASAQVSLIYGTSSATQPSNTVQRVNSSGTANNVLFTASGAVSNGVSRCTALALDPWNGKIFVLDAGSNALWSVNLDGSSPTLVRNHLSQAPLGMALDVVNRKIYYSTSSTIQNSNTIQRMDYSGSNNVVLFTATGPPPSNGVRRCTALALDSLHSKILIADAGSNALWNINLDGSGLKLIKSGLGSAPLDLALDVTNQLAYFATSSTIQNSNTIQRVAYNGSGSTILLIASNGVSRCTSLDLDVPNGLVYFSDAGNNALWRVSAAGGAPFLVKGGLSAATVRKVRLLPSFSLITVVNTNDSGPGSLRQALTDIASPGVITFASSLFTNGPAVVSLSTISDNTYGPSALAVDKAVTILGPSGSSGLIVTRSNTAPNMRLFYVTGTGNLTLRSVLVTNGLALGAPGGSGYQRGGSGGGAGGLGGAIFNEGTLNLEAVTFAANQAQGGDGGGQSMPWGGLGSGGGGGGLGGTGGAGGQRNNGGDGGPPNGGIGGSGTTSGTPGGVGGGGGGGGSGAGGSGSGHGANGGFGGGGGGGGAYDTAGYPGGTGGAAGNGGFAGGGGGGGAGTPDGAFGSGGFAGGNGGQGNTGGNVGNGGGGGGGLGGAIFNNRGILTITNCTFSENTAVGGAGGTIATTAGSGWGLGGAIFNRSGVITVLNSTFAGNRADQGGGGVFNLGDATDKVASVSLRNSILCYTPAGAADYSTKAINSGIATSGGKSNLVQLNSGFAGGIISSADPSLDPLSDNGGPTPTRALRKGSPAIDAGDSAGLPPTDQRGYPRIADGDGIGSARVDLGAVENGLVRLRTIPQTASAIQLSGFQLFLTGESNRLYVMEFSPNLTNWTKFATSHVFGIEVPVIDTHTGAEAKRFYRAHTWP